MAVDVQAFTTSYDEEVRRLDEEARRLREEIRRIRTDALVQFHAVFTRELETHPEHRERLMGQLREHRARYREEGREEMEDLILDAMDMLTGWSARAARV